MGRRATGGCSFYGLPGDPPDGWFAFFRNLLTAATPLSVSPENP